MFNWSDQEQVRGTVWSEYNKSEDHTVPHSEESEEGTSFSYEDCEKEQRDGGVSNITASSELNSRAENHFFSCKLENSSSLQTDEGLYASQIEMDMWADFSNITTSNVGYTDGNNQDLVVADFMNHLSDPPNLNLLRGDTMQLDGDADMFGQDDKGSDNFLDCDWASIGDLDDLDKILRNNDGIFGHEMIDDVDGFLSSSTDVISGTAQSIPMPDIPLCQSQPSDNGCSTFQSDEHSDGKRNVLHKEENMHTMKTEEQTQCPTCLAGENFGKSNKFSQKVDGQKSMVKSQDKAEEKMKNKPSGNVNAAWSNNFIRNQHTTPSHTFHSKSISQKMLANEDKPMESIVSTNQVTFTGHGFATYAFPSIPLASEVHVDRNQKRSIPVYLPEPHRNFSNKLPDVKSSTMTPQEKIEKLRRRQKMHAMLAIQQQQKQYSRQNIDNDIMESQSRLQKHQSHDAMPSTIVVEECSHKLPSTEMDMLADQDETCRISSLIDGRSVAETIYHQLQDAMGKLDTKVRISIRDSLFRLARSVMERQNASDRSSTNKTSKEEDEFSAEEEESSNHERTSRSIDSERDTNPIDRIVAQLLFQGPTISCPRPAKDEVL